MSSEGGLTSQKHGGAHLDTHGSQVNTSLNLSDAFSLSNPLFTVNQGSEHEKRIQNGGDDVAKNVAEDNLNFLSSDVDLDSYEREVVENNAEWLKSRCRNIVTVDFDIASSVNDPEELFTDPLTDEPVIPISICSDEGVDLANASVFFDEKTSTNDVPKSSVISFTDSSLVTTSFSETNTVLSTGLSQSVQTFSTGTATCSQFITPPVLKTVPAVSLLKNSKPATRNLETKLSSAGQVSSEKSNVSIGLPQTQVQTVTGQAPAPTSAVQILPQVLVTSNTIAQSTAPSAPNIVHLQDNQTVLGANLKLHTISISTDKVANSTQIVVNTSQGQQLYHINTADLTQATTALEPLSRQAPALGPTGDGIPMGVQTGFLILPTPTLPTASDQVVTIPIESVVNSSNSILPANPQLPQKLKRIYICTHPGCEKVFRKLSKMKIHSMRHTGERPFKCDKPGCDWAFTTLYKLRRHEESHQGRKDYYCDFEGCGKKFTTVYNLNSHRKLHERPCVEICSHEGCGEKFPTKRQLDLHMKGHSGEKTYKCPVDGCNKTFYSQHCMGSHPRVHLHDQDYLTCKFEGCGKVFEKACRLKQHMRSHTGEKPYVCFFDNCGWAFTTASKLKRHQAKHTGVRKWKCQHCGRGFMRSEHLKGHMITHSGDRPYSCPVEGCKLKFTAKSSLYVHMKKHDSSKNEKITYHCPIEGCLKKYATKSALRQHIVKHHLSSGNSTGQVKELDLVPLLGGELQDLEILNQAANNATIITTATTVSKSEGGAPTSAESAAIPPPPTPQTMAPPPPPTMEVTDLGLVTIDPLEFIAQPASDVVGVNETQRVVSESQDLSSKTSVTDTVSSVQLSANDLSRLSPALLSQLMGTIDKSDTLTVLPKTDPLLESLATSVMDTVSGSARTDLRGNQQLSNRTRSRRQCLKEKMSSVTLDSSSFEEPKDDNFFVPEAFTTPLENSTSRGITFKDPETGVMYIQTQLLQDDPPTVVADLYSDDPTFTSELSDLPEATSSDLEHSLHTSDFTGSTINLEDLQ